MQSTLQDLMIYHEVMNMSKTRGIDLTITIGDKDMDELGFTVTSREQILITVNPNSLNDIAVLTHELLHAKLYLLKYPSVAFYKQIKIPIIHSAVSSMQNSIQHMYIFPEMRKMRVSQESINKRFIADILMKARKAPDSINQLNHGVNFFESYLRDSGFEELLLNDSTLLNSEGYDLFIRMKKVVEIPPVTQKDYRKAYIGMFKIIDDWLYKHIGRILDLKQYLCIDPVYEEHELHLKASDRLYVVDIEQYPHYFIMDKEDGQCSFFLPKSVGVKDFKSQEIMTYLDTITLKDILNLVLNIG